jgi:amino acid adenylation domain-containing protein
MAASRVIRSDNERLAATEELPSLDTVERLPILSEAERRQILFEWNDTRAEFPVDKCVHQLFEQQVARGPNETALVFEGASLSYAELNRRANRLAHYLIGLGVTPDARVAICVERGFEMVIALLAVIKAGGAYVPLDPGYPVERLRYMLEDSSPVALLTQTNLLELWSGSNDTMPIVDLTSRSPAWAAHSDIDPGPSVRNLAPVHLAYIIYTSGSTGKPKGVMVEHRSLVNRLVWMQNAYALDRRDAVLQKTPFSFDVSVWEFFWPLIVGARLVMARPEGHKDPGYLVEAIHSNKITTLHFVPSMLQVFLEHPEASSCSSLVRVVASGEALPAWVVRKFHERLPRAELHNLYGPTEATVDVTSWTCDWDPARTVIPIGKPISNTSMYILNGDLEPVPVGVDGELFIGGVGVARGYLNRPELTAERFLPDPFLYEGEIGEERKGEPAARMYRTGDLCRWLPDGNIEYLGRNDFQVKIRGFRIELGEIESRLVEYPGVREAVVVARDEERGDKRLIAYLVLAPGLQLREPELREMLGRRLPDHMVPADFVVLDSMPLTANGKLDRAALPPSSPKHHIHRESAGSVPAVGPAIRSALNGAAGPSTVAPVEANFVRPSDTLEVQLIEIWEDVLGVTRIGVRDDFFKLGGHSLLAARMFARVAEKLHKNLPLATMFRAPTIEKLAEVIRAEGWKSHWSVLVPIQETGTKPPLFMVHGLGGNVLSFYGLRFHIPPDQPLYGLQADGLNSARASSVSIPDMAEYYIREIRSVQPSGPYFIGGFSAGGLVAYEMAQQLTAAGEKVQFLALFDSWVETAGGYWLKSFYSKTALRMSMRALRANWDYLQRDGLIYVISKKILHLWFNLRIMAWLVLGKVTGRRKSGQQAASFLTPTEAFTRAIRTYEVKPYIGSAVSFRSTPPDADDPLDADGWGRYIGGKLETQEIYGGHEDIFREPHIGRLANQLMDALAASRSEQK